MIDDRPAVDPPQPPRANLLWLLVTEGMEIKGGVRHQRNEQPPQEDNWDGYKIITIPPRSSK
jgi:hypothetical protein